MSTHNIGFYEDLTKIIFEFSSISSNTHLISFAVIINRNGRLLYQLHETLLLYRY